VYLYWTCSDPSAVLMLAGIFSSTSTSWPCSFSRTVFASTSCHPCSHGCQASDKFRYTDTDPTPPDPTRPDSPQTCRRPPQSCPWLGWPMGWVELGWVQIFPLVTGWVGLGQSADGLGCIGSHKMDSWSTLGDRRRRSLVGPPCGIWTLAGRGIRFGETVGYSPP